MALHEGLVRWVVRRQQRAQQPDLVATWSLAALAPALPLAFPVDPDRPPSPKPSYRSTYQPPDPAARPDPATWGLLSDVELALALIDFSPLERELATMDRPTAKGQKPFHPARSRPSCHVVTDACYQPLPERVERVERVTPVERVEPATGRPCRAREQGKEGCACTTPACHDQCRRASRLDPEARFIHYAGRDGARGTDVFGYRSIAERRLDDRFAVAWAVSSGLDPANTDERTVFVARVQTLTATVPDLPIGEWLDDAGVGFGDCLDAVWDLGALRMIDIRADPSDRDPPPAWRGRTPRRSTSPTACSTSRPSVGSCAGPPPGPPPKCCPTPRAQPTVRADDSAGYRLAHDMPPPHRRRPTSPTGGPDPQAYPAADPVAAHLPGLTVAPAAHPEALRPTDIARTSRPPPPQTARTRHARLAFASSAAQAL